MTFLEDIDSAGLPTIPDFYKGKTIFITGGTGFMGKVLIEKLLYSCSDLDRIYLLMRNKKGVKSEDRLEAVYSSHCFDRLRQEKPTIFNSKVFVIAGDVMEIGLGLSEEDRALLVNRVNVVFHVAASVRFDDPLPYAATLNLRGTREVIELVKDIRDLYAMVHVSTSYSNTNRDTIQEVIYPPHANWRDTLAICDQMDEHTLRVLTPKYLGELPNTYTFTKQLAEHVVYEQRGKLPIVIIRPSIVISSVSEPMAGWLENFNGPTGLLVASGKGIMRSVYSNPDLKADYIPVDFAINSMIAAGWSRGSKKLEITDDVPIYNCCAGNLNTISSGELIEIGKEISEDLPLEHSLWAIGGSITTSKTIHYIKVILLHLIPALLVDTILWLLGRKPMLTKVQRRIYIANLALTYYITKQWTFDNKNFIQLRSHIKKEDRDAFFYDIENVERYQFFRNGCLGAKIYLLKESLDNLPKARAHFRRMKYLDMLVQFLLHAYLLWWILTTNCVQNMIQFAFGVIGF